MTEHHNLTDVSCAASSAFCAIHWADALVTDIEKWAFVVVSAVTSAIVSRLVTLVWAHVTKKENNK